MNPNLVRPNVKVKFSRRFSVNDGSTSLGRAMREESIELSGKIVGKNVCSCTSGVIVQLDKESRKQAFDKAGYPYMCLVVPVGEVFEQIRRV